MKMVDSTVAEDATLTVTGGSVTTTGTFTEMPGYRIEDVSGKVQILDQPCEPGDSHNAKGQPSVLTKNNSNHPPTVMMPGTMP